MGCRIFRFTTDIEIWVPGPAGVDDVDARLMLCVSICRRPSLALKAAPGYTVGETSRRNSRSI